MIPGPNGRLPHSELLTRPVAGRERAATPMFFSAMAALSAYSSSVLRRW